jgi:2-polyprenyl-3-methyl-5-hydroxy-6-metoxy-1,4-benzoquinol methylase
MLGKLAKGLFGARTQAQFDKASAGGTAAIPAGKRFSPRGRHEWQSLIEPDEQTYADVINPQVLNLLRFAPTFALEVGCNAGALGALVKQNFPLASVWGVEPNVVPARIAGDRLDRVLCQPIEEIDWQAEGIERGQIDTVFLFDVLEHIYNPWSTLLTLRDLVADEAQVIASIPNARNLYLIQDLVHGNWRYRKMGLLDITHIRFFTFNDMMRMFYQTGFRVLGYTCTMCERSKKVFEAHAEGPFPKTIELDSATITVHSQEDLVGLCALQHVYNLKPAEYEELSSEERTWIDAPPPDTMAYAGEP